MGAIYTVDFVENSGVFTLGDHMPYCSDMAELLYCESIDNDRIQYFMSVPTTLTFVWNSTWYEYLQTEYCSSAHSIRFIYKNVKRCRISIDVNLDDEKRQFAKT